MSMTIQQLQTRYQQALENNRTAREALRLAEELVKQTEDARRDAERALYAGFRELEKKQDENRS